MDKQDILTIAEGLGMIEKGVEKIQSVMKEKKIRSIQEVAEQLIPFFKKDDESLTDTVIKKLGQK